MDSALVLGLLWYAVFLGSTICHEAAHAWAALKLGDDTAARGGQVSLNPLPHIRREPIGMIAMPILTYLSAGYIAGWASAPYSVDWARRYPKRAAVMALAGPGANLAIAIGAGLLIRLAFEWHVLGAPYAVSGIRLCVAPGDGPLNLLAQFLSIACTLNLFLMVFNLVPLPPLDGSNAPLLLLSDSAAAGYSQFLRSPWLRMVGLFVAFKFLSGLYPPLVRMAAHILYPTLNYA